MLFIETKVYTATCSCDAGWTECLYVLLFKEVAFQHSIEANHYKDALDLFTVLEKRNIIGNSKPISELAQIFENIQRNDLVTKVYETATKMQGR